MTASIKRTTHSFFSCRRTRYELAVLLLAVMYGLVLASLPLDVFKDRHNYLAYASDSSNILQRYWSRGLLTTLANEPVWLIINISLSAFFSSEITVRIVIAVSSALVAYQVLRTNPRHFPWLLLFLLAPQVIKNHIVHLRQGMAIALFLTGWFSTTARRWVWLLLTPFVHASFFFVLIIFGIDRMLGRLKMASDVRISAVFVTGIVTALSLSSITAFLGARQATQYAFAKTNVSGLGFLFWLAIFILFVLEGRTFVSKNSFALGVLVFYLATYFLIEPTARIFESATIAVLVAGLTLTRWRRVGFLVAFIFFVTLSYGSRLSTPWLGFGLPGT